MASDYWFYSVGPVVRSSPQPRHGVILPQLLIGEYLRPEDAAWIKRELGVTSVLCLQDHIDLARKALTLTDLAAAYRAAEIDFDHWPVPDGDPEAFSRQLPAIVGRLADRLDAGHRVYLHCSAGMNRAPTAAIAYLHRHAAMTLSAARDFVKQRHPCVPYMTMLESHYASR